jgi:hypothetical protein
VRLLLSHPDTDLNAVDHDGASILARVHRHYGHIESWYESITFFFFLICLERV